MANHVHSAPRTMLATTALLLMTSLVSAEPALALASPTSLNTVVGNTLGILTQIPGRIVSGIAPLTQLLDPMLFELLGQSGLSVLPSGVTSLLTTIVADLVNTALPVPPPFRPDDEARRFGFLAESFNLTTPDGYILENFRIRNGSCPQYRAVLVVPPSVLANTAAFLLIEEQSLVWRLARECYDVYLLNCRGMLFARNHVELSDQSNEFWDFDQKEYAEDVALGMDFVYNRTGGRRMRMVALDQGGTSFFITNAFMDRRYQDMLASAYLYVPIANLGNLKSIAFSTLSAVRDALSAAGTLVLHDELAFMNPTIHSVLYNLCGRFAPTTCNYLLQFLGGPGELNTEKFSYSFRNVLDSTSIKAFNFYLNMIGNDGYFKLYDYGSGNLEKYGTANPPDIPLNATTVPCTVFALTASTVTVTQDVRSTFARLAPSAQHRYVELENLDSLAPLVPLRPDVVYDPLLEALEEDLTAIPE